MIAGLETPTSGKIEIGDQVVFDSEKGINVPANKRKIGFLFQNYALWPNMTVYQNISFGLKNMKTYTKEQIEERVKQVSRLVKIEPFMDRYPAELSGGQQQRVAIARTLAPEPQVIFMDEPLSNLDAKLRLEMRSELQRLHLTTGRTFVYVTHDQMEAMTLASKICLIENGLLQQYDAPLDVYNRPNNLFVADFVGNPSINFIEAKGTQGADGVMDLTVFDGIRAKYTFKNGTKMADWRVKEDDEAAAVEKLHAERAKEKGYVEKGNKDERFSCHISKANDEEFDTTPMAELTNADFILGIRPEFVNIASGNGLAGEIYGVMPTGMESTLKIRVDDWLLTGVVFGAGQFSIGAKVDVSFAGNNIMLFDRASGDRIACGTLELA
jgi:ABC-type sugar transport system ATPase subunit